MSRNRKTLDNALGFIVLSAAAGVGLYSWVTPDATSPATNATAARQSDGQDVLNQANAVADALDREADRQDAAALANEGEGDARATPSGVEGTEEVKELPKQPDDTVFVGGESGTLTCSVGQHRPFSVGWRMDDGDGSVTVDGEASQGKATSEWSPAPNKIVSWIEVTRGLNRAGFVGGPNS